MTSTILKENVFFRAQIGVNIQKNFLRAKFDFIVIIISNHVHVGALDGFRLHWTFNGVFLPVMD